MSTPVFGLYRDVLQSVFQWATLGELHRVRSVHTAWLHAVDSMHSMIAEAFCTNDTLPSVARSSFASRIGCFLLSAADPSELSRRVAHRKRSPLMITDNAVLPSLVERTPNLHSLSVWQPMTRVSRTAVISALRFPSKLRSLHLNVIQCDFNDEQVRALLTTISRLTSLEHLALLIRELPAATNIFAPLIAAPRLTDLSLSWRIGREWSDEELESLRCIPGLTALHLPQAGEQMMRRFLPVRASSQLLPDASLQSASFLPLLRSLRVAALEDDSLSELVRRFPSLTELEFGVLGSSLECLSGLKDLRSLSLYMSDAESDLTPERMVEGLARCTGLTSLTLRRSTIKPAVLTQILQRCTHIGMLHLFRCDAIISLEFLALPRLVTDLIELGLHRCPAAKVECLVPIEQLKALRRLTIVPRYSFEARRFTVDRLRAFKRSLPQLRAFDLEADGEVAQRELDAVLAED